MIEPVEIFFDVPRYGYVDVSFLVVSVESKANVYAARPVVCDFV